MARLLTRDLTTDEETQIEEVLRRLRQHFHEWSYAEGREHHLVGFAFYEGCGGTEHCGALLAEAAPFALGRELVSEHGFQWVMIGSGARWRHGVMHPGLNAPIELLALETVAWDRKDYDQRPDPGRITHDSLDRIVATALHSSAVE